MEILLGIYGNRVSALYFCRVEMQSSEMTSVMTNATLTPDWLLCPFLNQSQVLVILRGAYWVLSLRLNCCWLLVFFCYLSSHHCSMYLMCPLLDH